MQNLNDRRRNDNRRMTIIIGGSALVMLLAFVTFKGGSDEQSPVSISTRPAPIAQVETPDFDKSLPVEVEIEAVEQEPVQEIVSIAKPEEKLPTTAAGWYQKGWKDYKSGAYQDAVTSFTEVTLLQPERIKAYTNMARAQIKLGNFSEAEVAINNAVTLDSTYADAYLVKGRVSYSLGNLDGAVESYTRSIELSPENPYALNNLALIYIQQEKFVEAHELLLEAIEHKNDVAYFHNNLGIVSERLGKLGEARMAFEAAIAFDPDSEKSAKSLARVTALLKQTKEDRVLVNHESLQDENL